MDIQAQKNITLHNNQVTFYTYSGLIGMDNQCRGWISHCIKKSKFKWLITTDTSKDLVGKEP